MKLYIQKNIKKCSKGNIFFLCWLLLMICVLLDWGNSYSHKNSYELLLSYLTTVNDSWLLEAASMTKTVSSKQIILCFLPNVFNHYLKKRKQIKNKILQPGVVYLELYCFIYRNDWWSLVSQLLTGIVLSGMLSYPFSECH